MGSYKSCPLYDYESAFGYFMVKRLNVVQRCGAMVCLSVVKILGISSPPTPRLIRRIVPDKFYFSHVVHYNELTSENSIALDEVCSEGYGKSRDLFLGESPRKCSDFNERAAHFLREWGIEKKGSLILAKADWVDGIKDNICEISGLIDGYSGEIGVEKACIKR
jgi:hypothetical protein